ncbi:hypothetical protein A3840_00220 [Devosia elaeis]|uniref:Uncharacterized protein n=2 Tax=Devosia elaeis TaxID=1770058 RepID=A0A178I777_9HYPH|nr:hypothetical protein A3840_00220 [Devosia elaeis]
MTCRRQHGSIINTAEDLAMTDLSLAAQARSPKAFYTIDAAISGILGIALLAGAGPIADLAGMPAAAGFLMAVGAFLLPWALFNYAIGTATGPAWSAILANIAGDAAWVAISILLLATHWTALNGLGQTLLAGQALFVAIVFLTKLRGAPSLRRS